MNTSQGLEICLVLGHHWLMVMAAALGAIIVAPCGHFNVRGVERVVALRNIMLPSCAAMSAWWASCLGAAWEGGGAPARLHVHLTPPSLRGNHFTRHPSFSSRSDPSSCLPSLPLLLRLPDLRPGTATTQAFTRPPPSLSQPHVARTDSDAPPPSQTSTQHC